MTTLMIYISALFLGFLIVVVVALSYAIMASEDNSENEDHDGVTLQNTEIQRSLDT